jgi:hypothetical protein
VLCNVWSLHSGDMAEDTTGRLLASLVCPTREGNVRFVSNEIQNTNIEHKADIFIDPPTYRRLWSGHSYFSSKVIPPLGGIFIIFGRYRPKISPLM